MQSTIATDQFLVCGLGSLGQHCVRVLRQFHVSVSAIDINPPDYWDVEAIPSLLTSICIGDCRDPELLEKCKIHQFRCILLVTGDERVNIEAGFVARSKNADIRLVIRSAKLKLNKLLSEQLKNSVAIEPTEITSTSFALAALGDETRGAFYLKDRLVQVRERKVEQGDPLVSQTIEHIQKTSRILVHRRTGTTVSQGFFQWQPDTRIKAGDYLLYLHFPSKAKGMLSSSAWLDSEGGNRSKQRKIVEKGLAFFPNRTRLREFVHNKTDALLQAILHHRWIRLVFFCLSLVLLLIAIGSLLFYAQGPGLTATDAIYAAVCLMLGGYVDLLGSELAFTIEIPWWLRLFGLIQTLTGTVLVGALYALITSHILATRFHFSKRPGYPTFGHILVVGWGRIGQKITRILAEVRQPFVVITRDTPQAPGPFPMLSGVKDTGRVLGDVHLETAKGIIAVTNDEMTNLELGLMAHSINPGCRMVLRTYHQRFGASIKTLFPYAHVLSSSALSAEAFAAAAFGENIINLFLQNGQTILVTQYTVEEKDTLNGHILARIAHGYGVVPIVVSQSHTETILWMPSESLRLTVGDQLTVLATIDSLRRIEAGERKMPSHQLFVHRVKSNWAKSEGVLAITKATDCTLGEAQDLLENLPGPLPTMLYLHQGHRLLERLRKMGIQAELLDRNTGVKANQSTAFT